MCARWDLHDDDQTASLRHRLGIPDAQLRFSADVAPGAPISIVRSAGGRREVLTATWWLCLDPRNGYKPKVSLLSYNSDVNRMLDDPTAASYRPYRATRCIIPASSFNERLHDKGPCHRIQLEGRAIALGGLYREYANAATGELVYSASIITLNGLAEWKDIHTDSMPLMLDDEDPAVIERWLDPTTDVADLASLLEPRVRYTQRVIRIGKSSKRDPIGEPFLIHAQEQAA